MSAPGSAQPLIKVAAVDDDPVAAEMISRCLQDSGCRAKSYDNPDRFLAAARREAFDVVVTDLRMPHTDGIEVLKQIKAMDTTIEVIILTADADKDVAIQALRMGAFDLLEKPIRKIELVETVKRTARYRNALRDRARLADQVSFLSGRDARKWGLEAFVGESDAIRATIKSIRTIQAAPRTSVLITGESGTGKELVARAIHFGSPRACRPFVPLNCSAIPGELAESTLFGHTRGAFTGANADVKGHFQFADGGTLFLDEIGDMPPAMQAKLLRVLEDGIVVPVGKIAGQAVDVRVLAATNSRLQDKIASGEFRSDLYYRLAAFSIHLPPLRERIDDIPLLARHFATSLSAEMGFPDVGISDEAIAGLSRHSFPGNVRELRNAIEQALIYSAGKGIELRHIVLHHLAPVPSATGMKLTATPPARSACGSSLDLRSAERELVRRAIAEADGNMSEAARLLGINRSKLYRKLAAGPDVEALQAASCSPTDNCVRQ